MGPATLPGEVPAEPELYTGPGCKVTFKDPAVEEPLDIVFTESPFGMSFTTAKLPIVISTVRAGSLAASLGVKVGFTVLKVNGTDVPASFEEASGLIIELSKALKK